MLQDFSVIHRRKPDVFAGLKDPVWSTCLRGLAFVKGRPDFPIMACDEVYHQHLAYQFLLEIICGLHSPIIGETEVLGQFKIFAQSWVQLDESREPLVQRLLNDAKAIRSRHLSGMGNQSYGSWLRKNLNSTSGQIHILGAGHLVQEILPYLEKQGEVILHARSPDKVGFFSRVLNLKKSRFDKGALVVAAPLSGEEIRQWLNGSTPEQIFDLRDNSSSDAVCPTAVPLAEIFGQIEQTKAQLRPVVEKIKVEIAHRSELVAGQERVRPQGWDDLCA